MIPSVTLVFIFSAGMIATIALGSSTRYRHRFHRRTRFGLLACLATGIIICIGYRAYFGRMVSLMQNDEPTIH